MDKDERIIGQESYFDDVLDLAEYLIKKHPKDSSSIMHKMFMIGFTCGQRSGHRKKID